MRRFRVVGLAVLAIVALPSAAFSHGIGGRTDLPVPLEYFIVGASLVMVLSFVALAVLWPEPRMQDGPSYRSTGPASPPRFILGLLGVLALLLVVGQLLIPLFGLETDPTRPSIAPVLVWVVFWLVVPFLSALIGNWYADANPWRTIGRGLRIGRYERRWVLDRVGVWPAIVALIVFTWLELISSSSGSPATLGLAALTYTFYLLGVSAWVGRHTAMTGFDAFTTYNRLFSAISPVGRDDRGRLVWRGWLRSLTVVPEWPGLWVFVVAVIGTVSFDGASGTDWFDSITFGLMGSTFGESVLLVASVAVIGLAYLGAAALAARLGGGGMTAVRVAQRFAHTLVPIALAYAVAHYFTLMLFEGQQLIAAVSDPFGLGWDLFATADNRVNFFITTSDPIWYTQVAVIVGGHVAGVILAHDRALADFARDAVRSQYAMLGLMVALTSLGLAILAG